MKIQRKLLLLLSYLLLVGIMIYTWVLFITGAYLPQWQHWVALILMVLNGLFYLRSMKTGTLFTGVVLILATFNLLAFFPAIEWGYLSFGSGDNAVHTPGIQLRSLLFLIIYACINVNYLTDLYVNRKKN